MNHDHPHEHGEDGGRPASFYASPQEALTAPREEFLYVACLHEGTDVDKPDFLGLPLWLLMMP